LARNANAGRLSPSGAFQRMTVRQFAAECPSQLGRIESRLMSDQPIASNLLARAHELMSSGQWQPAEAACRQAISVGPGEAQAWFFLGLTQLNRRSLGEAENSFHQAIALDDRPAIYWNLLA